MKNMFKVLALGVAATALFACTKETPVQENMAQDNVKLVEFTTTPLTKTVFGEPDGKNLPTLWTDKYSVALTLNLASPTKKSTAPESLDGGLTARFSAEIESDESGNYNIYAVSPYDAVVGVSTLHKSISISVPTAQTPTATSPDELAQIVYGKHDAGATFPSSVTMSFEHLTAYGKISFSNLSLADGESIVSVSLTATDNWAGRYFYYTEDNGTYSTGEMVENSASSTITINTTSASNIWFGCAPVDLGGKTIDVVINTNKGTTYEKTITIPADKKFESGKVNAFTINMSGITGTGAVVYKLVKNATELTTNSEVIIVANESDYALSTTQNSNNRGQAGITKSADGATISSPGADVQVLTIKAGNKTGTLALYTGDGYLYAASSGSNHLRTETVLTDNSSWNVSITDAGVATLTAQGSNTHNVLLYNSSSKIFSCYSSSQQAVSIYKKEGSGDPAPFAATAKADGDKTSITVNEGDSVTLTCSAENGTPDAFQWYSNDTESNENGTEITGAESSTYNVPTTTAGTYYFYCYVLDTEANEATTNVVKVVVIAAGSGSETKTLKLENIGTDVGSSIVTSVTQVTVNGCELNYYQGKKQGSSILLAKSSNAFISNKTPIPGAIKSVTVYINKDASSKTTYHCAFSTTECTEVYTTGSTAVNITAGSSNNYTCSVSGAQYFCISLGNANNGQVLSIDVEYTPNN